MRFLFLPTLLLACSEYDLTDKQDGSMGDDSGEICPEGMDCSDGDSDTTVTDSSDFQVCESQSFPAGQVQVDSSCEVVPQVGTFSPIVKWHKADWAVSAGFNNIMMTPIVLPLNDDNGDGLVNEDDTPDILALTFQGGGGSNSILRAISGADGSELFSVNNSHQITGALAGGDIDNDGLVEIVAPGSGMVYVYENDGSLKFTVTGLGGHIGNTSDAPAIADLNADGNPEIIMGRAIINNQGQIVGTGAYGIGKPISNVGATPSVADLDVDGAQEVVVGNAIYRMDGTAICNNSNNDGYTAIGDFDNDGQGEVVVSSGNGEVRLQETDCSVVWTVYIPGVTADYYGGPPTIADYDGDGFPEIGVAANSSYSVFDTDGTMLWQQTTQDASSGNTGSAVFDFEGDGIAEAIYPDETRVWAFNGPDGAVKLSSTSHSSNTWTEYAVIADIDNDNHAEIVVPNNNVSNIGTWTGITVLEDADDSWQSGRPIWNQHAYSITNVNDDGTIPASPSPNWATYNNFRSGDLAAATGGSQADLIIEILDICRDECEEGRLYVWVRVGNRGTLDLGVQVSVKLLGRKDSGTIEVLAETRANPPIISGRFQDSIELLIERDDIDEFVDVIAVVDNGTQNNLGAVIECYENNNQASWGDNVCNY
ncbi:MAG: FG-GAP-like repeat-containing protein [Myxococcota bacterium]|nr:FG-GAP-like repeat-containing protein [Myxococcota bacterium]